MSSENGGIWYGRTEPEPVEPVEPVEPGREQALREAEQALEDAVRLDLERYWSLPTPWARDEPFDDEDGDN